MKNNMKKKHYLPCDKASWDTREAPEILCGSCVEDPAEWTYNKFEVTCCMCIDLIGLDTQQNKFYFRATR